MRGEKEKGIKALNRLQWWGNNEKNLENRVITKPKVSTTKVIRYDCINQTAELFSTKKLAYFLELEFSSSRYEGVRQK